MRFLFVDRIIQMTPGEFIVGIKHITRDEPYLTTDDNGHLCFISSLIGETLGQLAAWNVMYHNRFTLRPVAGVVASAKIHRPAYVGETLFLQSYIEEVDDKAVQYHSIAKSGDEVIFSVDGALGPLLPMADFISQDDIQQQFFEIYHPVDSWENIQQALASMKGELLDSRHLPCVPPMIFDRILESNPGVMMVAEKRISRGAPYFPDHFPKKPVLPMTVLLECKINLAIEFLRQAGLYSQYRVSELRKIKMNEFVQPGDQLISYVKMKDKSQDELTLAFRSEVNGKRVCVVEVVFIPRGN